MEEARIPGARLRRGGGSGASSGGSCILTVTQVLLAGPANAEARGRTVGVSAAWMHVALPAGAVERGGTGGLSVAGLRHAVIRWRALAPQGTASGLTPGLTESWTAIAGAIRADGAPPVGLAIVVGHASPTTNAHADPGTGAAHTGHAWQMAIESVRVTHRDVGSAIGGGATRITVPGNVPVIAPRARVSSVASTPTAATAAWVGGPSKPRAIPAYS